VTTALPDLGHWSESDTTISKVERQLAALRAEAGGAAQRTAVMTHVAWVPPGWEEAALDTLHGLNERHPSRTILLLPDPAADDDRIDAAINLRAFSPHGEERIVCSEVITLQLLGDRSIAPASVVLPLLIPDLPAFLRWRGLPAFGESAFERLIDVADRLIVDSTEWGDLPGAYVPFVEIFERTAASDIAWARTERWRRQLASLWPGIAEVDRIRVRGTAAQAHLLAGWLRSRLTREVALEHEPAKRLEGVELDGEAAPFPPGDPPPPSDLLSEQLDQFGRDRVYEAAVRSAARA
jgi:hypothetical protein